MPADRADARLLDPSEPADGELVGLTAADQDIHPAAQLGSHLKQVEHELQTAKAAAARLTTDPILKSCLKS